ncbi:sulfurtransferase [uncultured Clostridium sp.]|jgi:thiosulfate/3-mercaptopyruvate sulfurtransferase|uniref:sulfurtransferase n=1 Tax=uncultured Clostridium sp. TaxID=59620 RepID=UPI002638DA7C|nr:rhodanese-like domain-containing protein [uncultured Clostridium sp.]
MNNKIQKAVVAIVAIIVFFATFFGSTREQVVVEAKKIVSDSNSINNEYLMGIQSLENALGAKGLVILDIRSEKEYNQGHILGAIDVSWNQFIDKNSTKKNNQEAKGSNYTTNWTNFINKDTLTKELDSLGVTENSTVVIYGDSNGDDLGELGKLSWMFRMVGIQSKMLNGGYKNWESQGFKTTTEIPSIEKSNMIIDSFVPLKVIKKEDIQKNISKIKILELVNDVKGSEINVQAQENKVNDTTDVSNKTNSDSENVQLKTNEQDTKIDPPVKGVIQIKLSDMLNPNGTIKPVSQLQDLFSSKGIDQKDIVLFYNTDKGNLAFLTLMLNMADYNNIESYNASLKQVVQITTQILKKEKAKDKEANKDSNDNSLSQNNNIKNPITDTSSTNTSSTNQKNENN